MYNLIEYSDNYSDILGSLKHFKRDKLPINDAGTLGNIYTGNSSSF